MYSVIPRRVIAPSFGNPICEATITLSVTFIMSQFAGLQQRPGGDTLQESTKAAPHEVLIGDIPPVRD
jgi:hypothetical protein